MEFFRIGRGRDIPFMRYSLVFNVISLITFITAAFFLIYRGLPLSIEFTGGTVLEVHYPTAVKPETVRDVLAKMGYDHLQVQAFGTSNDVLIRLPLRHPNHSRTPHQSTVFQQQQTGQISGQISRQIIDALTAKQPDLKVQRVEFVGPQVGDELAKNGLLALLCVVIGIAIYLSVRFEWKYAVAGIIANLHDVIIILGFFAFFQWEFSLPVLAAVLAVLGYSVNESVVVFDRIRETFINDKNFSFYKHRDRTVTVPEVINHAITSTMSRTLITHGSTQMMVLSMLAFGGPTLHFFSLALTIGILFGIYSSVFVAASLAMWLGIRREDLIKPHKKPKYDPHDPNAGAQV